jgi:transposase-like protein
MKKTHKMRYTEQKMLTYYEEWQESGLGKKAYCQQKGLTASTFFYWIKKLALQKQSCPTPSAAAGFRELTLPAPVEITAARPATGKPLLEIEYPSGARLNLYRQVEASFIKSLL